MTVGELAPGFIGGVLGAVLVAFFQYIWHGLPDPHPYVVTFRHREYHFHGTADVFATTAVEAVRLGRIIGGFEDDEWVVEEAYPKELAGL